MRALTLHRKGGSPLDERALAVIEALCEGEVVSDEALDALYPKEVRAVSPRFFTPVATAVRAAKLCAPEGRTRVLDVGAGVGRFCLVGALVTEGIFVGIEHREWLVDVGREVLASAGARGARLVHGTLEDVDFAYFDAFYLYNPFEENLLHPSLHLDASVTLSIDRYLSDVERIEGALDVAPPGTRVVTYHGFGGTMPPGYARESLEPGEDPDLSLWVKQAEVIPIRSRRR